MNVKSYLTAPIPRWAVLVTLAASTGGSIGGTYLILKRKHEEEFEARLEQEVAATVKFITSFDNKPATPMDVEVLKDREDEKADKFRGVLSEMSQYEDLVVETGYTDRPEPEEPTLEEISHNIFTDAQETLDWDPAEEAKLREGQKIYIIEHDEYFGSDKQTIQLTWYMGDEVLADEKDEHIPIPESVVGDRALKSFGHGSRDENIVFVRNDKLDIDIEVSRVEGKYTEQALGFMQHDAYVGGNRRRVLRNHPFDDD